jgi:hypothetical protein
MANASCGTPQRLLKVIEEAFAVAAKVAAPPARQSVSLVRSATA